MLIAVTADGIYTQAYQAEQKKDYRCPVCLRPVVLKQGRYKIAHFSHQRLIDCYKSTYKTESLAHLKGKHQLYDMARDYQVDMEYFLSDIEQIPDILINRHLALELQLSVIPVDAIMRRSEGYQSLGMSVIWIMNEQAIAKQNDTVKLTLFQRSLVQSCRMQFYSYDSDKECFYSYQLLEIMTDLSLKFIRSEVTSITHFLQPGRLLQESKRMHPGQKAQFIRQCLTKRDIREPTLSALYQLGINHRKLPHIIGIIVPHQFYIRTHPITWQSELLLMLKNKTFNNKDFTAGLEFYALSDGPLSREAIAADLIEQYSVSAKQLDVQ